MSELRDECYKCLNNRNCLGGAEYGSLYCMMNRRLKMQNEDDSVYAHKFATMQKQIDDKDKKIKELEDDLYIANYTAENSIPIQKVNNQIEKYEHMLSLTALGEIQKYTPEEILFKIDTLKELLEENK